MCHLRVGEYAMLADNETVCCQANTCIPYASIVSFHVSVAYLEVTQLLAYDVSLC